MKKYTVSDGKLLLTLQQESDGWFVVTSPTDPAMITQARGIAEAFAMARDAFKALAESRRDPEQWRNAALRAGGPAQKRRRGGAAEKRPPVSRVSNRCKPRGKSAGSWLRSDQHGLKTRDTRKGVSAPRP